MQCDPTESFHVDEGVKWISLTNSHHQIGVRKVRIHRKRHYENKKISLLYYLRVLPESIVKIAFEMIAVMFTEVPGSNLISNTGHPD
jgi:hypothetical protein